MSDRTSPIVDMIVFDLPRFVRQPSAVVTLVTLSI